MNQLKAAQITVQMLEERVADGRYHQPNDPGLSVEHLREMLKTMEDKRNEMSPAKMGRWLGWLQCAVVATTDLELEDMKELNVELSGD